MTHRARAIVSGVIFLLGYWLVWWLLQPPPERLSDKVSVKMLEPHHYGADAIEYGRHETVAYKWVGKKRGYVMMWKRRGV